MKKEGMIILLGIFLVLSACLSSAANDTKINKAYDCLGNLVKDKCGSLSLEEKAFASMATGKCISELSGSMDEKGCWPSSGCSIRETALSILALRRNNKGTDKPEEWLISKTDTPDDLIWYLEIDAQEESDCTISYTDNNYEVKVKSDKKVSGSAGSCLSVDSAGYWFKIDSDCYDKNFTVSCNKDFITALLYKKKTGSTVYVSSKTNFGSAQGRTNEKVNSLCFGTGCDYEGSLWATIALSQTKHDISPYLPYLIAMKEENEKYFPSTFLFLLTEYDEFFSDIVDLHANRYWKITDSPYHSFYDTALALLSLKGIDAQQVTLAKEYLLEVQGENGCWRDNVRDTAFILYAAWPKSIGPGPGPGTDYCEDFDYFCVSPLKCDEEDTVDITCEESAGKVCCKKQPPVETCVDNGGEICTGDQECSGSYITASDSASKCCKGDCAVPIPTTPECEQKNDSYHCRKECYSTEVSKSSYKCNSGQSCCAPAPKETSSYWWVYLLIILIILVALGIIFRNRLRTYIFQLQNKMKKGKGPSGPTVSQGRFPPTPPPQAPLRPSSRMVFPRPSPPMPGQPNRPMPQFQNRKPIGKTDKELEETLKKLKQMSK